MYKYNPFTNKLDIVANVKDGVGEWEKFTATADQTIFNTTMDVNDDYKVFIDGTLTSFGHSKTGAKQITFTSGRSEGEEIIIMN